MLLQSLLLLRLLVPVFHTLHHGVDDVADEQNTALCEISDEVTSKEEPQKSTTSVQISLADMLATSQADLNLKVPVVTSGKLLPAIIASLPAIALPGNTPPPQC